MAFASPRSYMLLSTAAAVATIALKTLAWRLTGSVGLLSDAMESGVNPGLPQSLGRGCSSSPLRREGSDQHWLSGSATARKVSTESCRG